MGVISDDRYSRSGSYVAKYFTPAIMLKDVPLAERFREGVVERKPLVKANNQTAGQR